VEPKKPDKAPTGLPNQPFNILYIFLAISAVLFINDFIYTRKNIDSIPYSQFLKELEENRISEVMINDTAITGELKAPTGNEKKQFVTIPISDPTLVDRLHAKGVTFRGQAKSPFLNSILSWVLPLFIFYLVWTFLFRRMGAGAAAGGMLGLTKSKAKVYMEKDIPTTFADVAGCDEAKEELYEIVSFLQDPKQYSRLGGRAPKGMLLVGPPGTGKTLLARALAGEAKVPFFSINGSEFVEMFVGLGAARVRDLFEQARKAAPCILFIDEIDALGKSRAFGIAGSGANDEKEQTLNQLLAEMDGFDSSGGVMIVAATNRPEILDPALLRAGRFDRQVLVNLPDQIGRVQILQVHVKNIQLDPSVRLERIASITPGFSGADLANLVNEAAIVATRRKADLVAETDFTQAVERIVAGLEQRKKAMNADEKRRIAFHEMGHATMALSRNSSDRVHKVSIIPRGMGALGYTLQRPIEDRYLMDQEEILGKIAVLLGGRASEKIFFKAVSTGASDDLAKATDIARAMVTQFGMSEKIGVATFEQRGNPFMQGQYQMGERRPFSEKTAQEIDEEVKTILDQGYQTALATLEKHKKFLEAGANRLLEIETLDETEIGRLWEQFLKEG
jgi:cell division protease FtsH